jgi:putative membrane protein
MKKTLFFMLAIGSVLTLGSCDRKANSEGATDTKEMAEDQNEEKMSGDAEDDSQFMVNVAMSNMLEVELSKVAQQKAVNKDVKAFADMMVNDHSKMSQEATDLAARKNVSLPSGLNDDYMDKVEKLRKYEGSDFDREYMDKMNDTHQDAINRLQKAINNVKDADINMMAQSALPKVQAHKAEIEKLQEMQKQANDNHNDIDKEGGKEGQDGSRM